ncbi:formate/nitrite transporter family protein, partial [Ralstonia pseudosolanacearum]|uniref:formate/nitrite transporter family protein n=1 Tax=Ralstonia pseudosolanacearum TaxID=1310165 RepID=UPI003D16B3D7
AFGLLGVCYLGQNLFTGKCGFLFQDKIPVLELLTILVVNLVAGYLVGMAFAAADPGIVSAASDKVASWDFSMAYFIKSVLCGVVMYLAVAIYKKGSPLGIIFGIPLFIFCGFQHCIANVITMGVATGFSWSLVLAVAGNFVGSVMIWWLAGERADKATKVVRKVAKK